MAQNETEGKKQDEVPTAPNSNVRLTSLHSAFPYLILSLRVANSDQEKPLLSADLESTNFYPTNF